MSILGHGLRRRSERWWETGCASLDLLSDRTRQELRRRADQYTAWPGQTLLAEGGLVSWVFVVLDGELALRKDGRDLRILRGGCLYGALEAVTHTYAPADLVARDVTRVLTLPIPVYTGLAATRPDFAWWVIRALAGERDAA